MRLNNCQPILDSRQGSLMTMWRELWVPGSPVIR